MKQGFAGTSIDAIQEAAQISRGTFFYHFDSKDALANDLLRRYAESDRQLTDSFMARAEKLSDDPLQQALLFLALHEEMFAEMEGATGCLFASYLYEAGLFEADAHGVISDSIDYFKAVFGGKLREAVERHRPPAEIDIDDLAELAYGVMQGAFILTRVHDSAAVMVRHTKHVRRYIEMLFGRQAG